MRFRLLNCRPSITARSWFHTSNARKFYWCRASIPKHMEITLTEQEDELCKLLDECTKTLKESEGIETSCRIAGGWVRDKVRPRFVRILM